MPISSLVLAYVHVRIVWRKENSHAVVSHASRVELLGLFQASLVFASSRPCQLASLRGRTIDLFQLTSRKGSKW